MREIPSGHNAALAVCSRTPAGGFIIVDGKVVNACRSFCLSCNADDAPRIEVEADIIDKNLFKGAELHGDSLECAKTLMMMIPTKYLVEELEKREGVSSDTVAPDEQMDIAEIDGPAKVLIITD